jgi:polyisoprenyl-phosphate glycosyltransferase
MCKPQLISVVVPVYRNRDTVAETCSRILDTRNRCFPHLEIEIVLVDDGSQDGTWEELELVQKARPGHVTLIKLSRNFGQVCAILAGYRAARGDAIITISADLQDPVDLMAGMVAHWEKGQEIVIAHRQSRQDDAASTIFSRIAYAFARRANPRIPSGGFDYLLLSRRATLLLSSFKGRHRFFQGDVLWMGLPTTFIPYAREKRRFGKSTWTFAKKFKYFTDLMLDSSYLPIRAMSGMGFVTAGAGLLYTLVIVVAWFRGHAPFLGWAPIMVTILLVGGMIMMMLGIIGEYLWRIFDDVKERPLYVVERQVPVVDKNAAISEQPPSLTQTHEEN